MKIGFVDYYLSEWHANNYPEWMKQASERLGLPCTVAYAWAELDRSPRDGVTTEEWCEKNGVCPCETLEGLCEKSDVIVILAPSDPEKHLGYAKVVLSYQKPTYIDKTFAPDLATAKEIFAIAERYGTPFFSSSALRYATELDGYPNCRQIITAGSGSSVDEYVIHLVEMVVKKLGSGARTIRAERFGAQTFFHIAYADDRCATMIFARSLPYAVYLSDGTPDGNRPVTERVRSSFFDGLIEDMLRFFYEKTPSFDPAQTLEVMRIREGAILAVARLGETVELA